MASIVNGLFAGRSGISSHGSAIAVIGDNISNASTIGYKAARAEFEDLVAGGQAQGRVVGSGSSISSVTSNFTQGTLEFTSKPLDLAIDGNGFFVVAKGEERFYSRAGNFKVDASGYLVNQNDLQVLGFPEGGTGTLEALNVNTIAQDSVKTDNVSFAGNVDSRTTVLTNGAADIPTTNLATGAGGASTTTYNQLKAASQFSTTVDVFDSLGAAHTIKFYFFHTASNGWVAQGYVNNEDVDTSTGGTSGLPRLLVTSAGTAASGAISMTFNGDGTRSNTPAAGSQDLQALINWNNGADPSTLNFTFDPFTQYASSGTVSSIQQDGQGIGTVTNLNIDATGKINALLSNGQSAVIGTIGLVNFSNPEGLVRIGNQLLQKSTASGEPLVGEAKSGTFGAIQAGSVELSTVDIADEFVKLITLQRGFQANSRIITTINQLLNEIIQLA